ncbi:uncharacterized protein LOC144451301 [Glandiceps talaboti]
MSVMILYRDLGPDYNKGGPKIADINELDDIQQKLQDDGLDPNISNNDKLRHLWRLYVRADTSLSSALKDVEELRIQQAQEMQEVENYVEHIRSLSDEREQLTLEFESENERLKAENEQLRTELSGEANTEITQMLMQEGLEDVADGTTSEQIAYLLVERARLMDELDSESRRTEEIDSQGIDGNKIQEILQKEREAFEEERKNIKMTKDSLHRLHEDELNNLNKEHQDKMRQKDMLIMELQNEVQKINSTLDKEKKARRVETEQIRVQDVRPLHSVRWSDRPQESRLEAANTKEMEVEHLKEKQRLMDEDKNSLNERIKELSEQLDKEKSARNTQEATVHKLRAVIERNKKILAEAEGSKQTLADEKRALEMKLSFLQKDLSELKEKEKSLASVQSGDKDLQEKLTQEIDDLKVRNRTLALELDTTNSALDRQRAKYKDLEQDVSSYEKRNDDKKKEYDNKEKSLYQKLESMRLQLETSKDEVAATQKEIVRIQKQHRKELSEARSEADALRDELAKEIQSGRSMQDNTAVIKELENSVEEVTRDRDTLARELQAIITKEKKNEEWSNKSRKLEDENKELQLKIEDANRQYNELEHEVKLHKNLNSDLQTRLDLSMQKADSAEKEADSLREEVSSLSGQLIKQYDTSKDGQEMITAKVETGLQSAPPPPPSFDDKRREEELQARNKMLEEEMAKVWGQMKDVLDKLSVAEQRKHELEMELERVSRRQREGDSVDGLQKHKTEVAERKTLQLQRDLDDTSLRMQAFEIQLRDTATLKVDLHHKQDELIKLRNQLQDEKLQRAMQEQQLADVKHQLNSMKDKEGKLYDDNMDLQYRLLDTESKLNHTEDKSRSAADMHQLAEMGKKALMEQVIHLQKEVENLQIDALKSGEKLDYQLRKYDEKKTYCKNKLQLARDIFTRQKRILGDHLHQLEDELSLTKSQLKKELEWKSDTENSLQKVLKEKNDLLTRLSEVEDAYRNSSSSLTSTEYRARYLEQENNTLQSRLDSASKQRNILEKLLKEYKLERQKEDITRAITGNNILLSPRPDTPGSSTYIRPSSGIGTSLAQSFTSADILSDGYLGLKSPPAINSSYINGLAAMRPLSASVGSMKTNDESDSGSMDLVEQL